MIAKILAVDVYMTDQFVKTMEKILTFRQLKTHYKMLEVGKYHIHILDLSHSRHTYFSDIMSWACLDSVLDSFYLDFQQ